MFKRENLITIAGIVWFIAGVNVLIIGLMSYPSVFVLPAWAITLALLGTIITGAAFGVMFIKMVRKHCGRIRAMTEDRQPFYRFFDIKSYIIMIFMISFGVALRVSGVAPAWFIAFFYTGLGFSLALAGMKFLRNRFQRGRR